MALGSAVSLLTTRLVEPVQGMHRAIAGRWFDALGPAATPVRLAHDATSNLVYGSVRLAATAVGAGLDATVTLELHTNDAIQAMANGLWGDQLGPHQELLGFTMDVRDRDGGSVTSGSDLSTATGNLVVLVHGLMATERCWSTADSKLGILDVVEAHDALTPLAIRYNTGLHVSDNGAQLSGLIEKLVASWPVAVESIALVGHSMGGLVVRSACESALTSGHRWIDHVNDVVTLSSPHRGAPLEKLVNLASWALGFASVTRPLADLLNRRSAGIKDLRFGAISEDDWGDTEKDELLRDTVGDHPLPPSIDHHFVAGVFTTDPRHPIGIVMGDLMVRATSSTGKGRLEPTHVVVMGGVRHVDMLHQPAVIEQVMEWLDRVPAKLPAGAA